MKISNDKQARVAWNILIEETTAAACARLDFITAHAPEMTPIEQMVFFQLLATGINDWPTWEIKPQEKFGKYRADFSVLIPWYKDDSKKMRIAIECDGHEFHERTKEQASRDKAKDREIQNHGFLIHRYTGSEIWNSAGGCAIDGIYEAMKPSAFR